jgi:hypothetical protein
MRVVSTTTAAIRHALLAGAEGLVVAMILAALVIVLAPVYTGAGTFAGKTDAAPTGSSIEFMGVGETARSVASYGDTVTTLSRLGRDYYLVYVRLTCRQSGETVLETWVNIKTGDWTTDGRASFTLGGQNWDGGGAACTADLLQVVMKGGNRTYKVLASADLAVGG